MPGELFAGPGQVRALCRTLDWQRTPLGALDRWPQSLKTAAEICLAIPVASFLWWGPELTQLYNEAALPLVGARHPGMLAAPASSAWSEVWTVLGPSLEQIPRLGGAEVAQRIRATHPNVRVLALTVHEGTDYVRLMLESGATGYVVKRAAADDLVRAIRAVARGDLYLDPAIAGDVVDISGRARTPSALSERETQVMRLIAEGRAAKDIANTLAVSVRTLETYRKRAMEKLGISTRAEIVRYALLRGWLKSG